MDIKTNNTVCFTGHRPKSLFPEKPYAEARRKEYQEIVDRIAEFVYEMYVKGCTRYISGGAQGFDQLSFWAVHKAKKECPCIINDVYIPFEGQEARWAEKGLFGQLEYRQMVGHADHVFVCTRGICRSDRKQVINALMYRNKCMVDDSGIVLGQFADDTWQDPLAKGGTADCLRYAKEMGRDTRIFGNCA